jgi:DNA-binding HxlR family transcriptional regulator
MILRASYNGLHHFEEFLCELGIARNILSNRLAKLVEHGILDRQPCADDRRRIEYRLTEKGFDLLPAMVALRQWGQKYGSEVVENPVLVDEYDRLPIGPVSMVSHDGRVLTGKDLRFVNRADLGKREDGTVAQPAAGFDRVRDDGAPTPLHIAAAR